jgi:hypothetical protein
MYDGKRLTKVNIYKHENRILSVVNHILRQLLSSFVQHENRISDQDQ